MTKQPTIVDFSCVTWRKSSRSDSGGGSNCVEVGAWRTSTRSSDGGGSNCVEVGSCPTHVAVRDTKNRSGGILSLAASEWSTLTLSIKDGSLDS